MSTRLSTLAKKLRKSGSGWGHPKLANTFVIVNSAKLSCRQQYNLTVQEILCPSMDEQENREPY